MTDDDALEVRNKCFDTLKDAVDQAWKHYDVYQEEGMTMVFQLEEFISALSTLRFEYEQQLDQELENSIAGIE